MLPYHYQPRPYQLPILRKLDSGIKRAVAVWHRRAGKEKTFINHTAKAAFQRVGTYYYIFPTYSQAKKVLWDGRDREGFPFMGHFPAQIVDKKNEQEMRIELVNGSAVQLVGSDNIDSIMGTNPLGCVFSEYALQDPKAWDFMRPILRENGGWAVFDYTPRGKNHGWKLYEMARNNPDWYAEVLTINDTKALTEQDIQAEREAGMNEELIQQEFYCSFEGVQFGAYFGKQLKQAEDEGRITKVSYEPGIGVETWWDLGIGDSTAIWFTQSIGREVRIIDYYEASGEGFPHFAKTLQARPYVYSRHHAPHDIEVRELGTGRSRKETAQSLGIVFETVENLPLEDGIEAARSFISRCWFDKDKCSRGLTALQSYHKAFDEKLNDWKSYPHHDWSSHAADAFRYLAVGHKITVKAREAKIGVSIYTPGEEHTAWMST
jgi:hypothetical protein